MKSTYSSNRQYTPVLLTFGILLLLCAVIGIQQCRKPEAFQNSRQITVTYVQDGFTRKKAVTVGLLEEPTPPEKEGYRFDGWFYLQDGTERQWDFARDEADADITLTARLTPIPYTLTLDPNGGTCGKKTLTVFVDQAYTLPIPTREGCFFAGWSRKPHSMEESRGVWSHAGDCTLTAIWTTCPYGSTVTFGRHEQDNDPNTHDEPLEWIVIDERDGAYLLLSKFIIDACPLETQAKNDWVTSATRAYLNGRFLQSTFAKAEQEQIKEYSLPDYGCTDRVFLLSGNEANRLIHNYRDAQGHLTAYAKERGIYRDNPQASYYGKLLFGYEKGADGAISYEWSIRDRSKTFGDDAYLCANGGCAPRQDYVQGHAKSDRNCDALRPAVWVKKEAVQS